MGHEMLLLLHKLRFRKSTVGRDGDWRGRGRGALHTASPLYSLDTVQALLIHLPTSSLPLHCIVNPHRTLGKSRQKNGAVT